MAVLPSGTGHSSTYLTLKTGHDYGKRDNSGTIAVSGGWAIDSEHTEGALKGKGWKGIYALDGDTLTTCDNAPNLDRGPPAAFEAKSGSGYVLITFKRSKA